MIDKEYLDVLKELPNTRYGKALEILVSDAIKNLDSVSGIPRNEDFDATCRGNAEAVKVLKNIFKFLIKPDKKAEKTKKSQWE